MASPRVDFTRPLLFRETADAVIHRKKTVTRRVAHLLHVVAYGASPWRNGALSKCYKRSPRAGGKPFAVVRIEDVVLEKLGKITQEECVLEGFPGLGGPKEFMLLFGKINNLGQDLVELAEIMVWRVQFTLDVKV